jgi:hypothetical protein
MIRRIAGLIIETKRGSNLTIQQLRRASAPGK